MEYRPWSKKVVNPIVEKSNKQLPILDIQLGGACNMGCIYCDTPKYGLPCSVDLPTIERLINEGSVEWIYICGLGEPTAPANLRHLKQILQWSKERNIGLSMFSNVLNMDQELMDYIDDGTLHIMFKLDTLDKNKMQKLYGISEQNASQMSNNIAALNEVIKHSGNATNLAASIVPTAINFDDVYSLIDYCVERGIFPLIGQLENAGKGTDVYNQLEVKEEDLNRLKEYMKLKHGIDYEMPICPATMSSVHITNTNNVICDERTGLSCPWFWLDEPTLKLLGDARGMSYDQIVKLILDYRQTKLDDVIRMEANAAAYPFGGCGGNVKKLLKTYVDISQRR